MAFTEEITQLLLVIAVLLLVLLGINFWTKKGGSITLPSLGNKTSGNADAGINDGSAESMDGTGIEQSGGGGGNAADRSADRFDLTGKNAEVAARVLKGMLKKDEAFKNQSDHS